MTTDPTHDKPDAVEQYKDTDEYRNSVFCKLIITDLEIKVVQLQTELADLQKRFDKLHEAPLCGDHAESWYCDRPNIAKQSDCVFCDEIATQTELAELRERYRND